MGVLSPLAERLNGDGQRKRIKRPPFTQQVPPREALHEVGLPLVLLGLGGLPWAALARESHVPALVLGVLECRVVVLQNNLGEDAVFASSFPLQRGQKQGEGGGLRCFRKTPLFYSDNQMFREAFRGAEKIPQI